MLSVLVALPFASLAQAQQPHVDQCAYDRTAMLALDVRQFDSTPGSGWRAIGDIPGCEATAADLIALYRHEHGDMLTGRASLLHHEAQLRAASNQIAPAVALLEEARSLATTPEIVAYRDAEIAFLRGDQSALLGARERLISIPEPDAFAAAVANFRSTYPDLQPPTWPPNLDVVDGLIACFGRPYAEAYAASCRPEGDTR